MAKISQLSLAAGEISPALWGRYDLVRWNQGLRTARNGYIRKGGGFYSRPGLRYAAEQRDTTKVGRIIPFIFSEDQSYVIGLEAGFIRVYKDGAPVTYTATAITGITAANPGVVTSTSHGLNNGEFVYVTGVKGMTQVNNRIFKVANKAANTFQLQTQAGSNVNTSSYTAYVSGGTVARIVSITNTFSEASLPEFTYAQDADILYLAHQSYGVYKLVRSSATSWALSALTYDATPFSYVSLASIFSGGGRNYRYAVTAVNAEGVESIPIRAGLVAGVAITGITQANPGVVTCGASHNLSTGDEVLIEGGVGMTEVNNKRFVVSVTGPTTFQLLGVNTSTYTAYSSSGGVTRFYGSTQDYVTHTTTGLVGNPHEVVFFGVAGAIEYRIYRAEIYYTNSGNGEFGWVSSISDARGQGAQITFRDTGYESDLSRKPPLARYFFGGSGNYPGVVALFQGRIILGGTSNNPEVIYGSATNGHTNFATEYPAHDAAPFITNVAGRRVGRVRHLLDVSGKLVTFTEGGEFVVEGDDAGIVTPDAKAAIQVSSHGSKDIPPLLVGQAAMYVQSHGQIIRDFLYDLASNGFAGEDLTLWAAHLFEGRTVVDWAFAESPDPVVWVVMSDGAILSLTYSQEQKIAAWCKHDTDGYAEGVCVIPEDGRDIPYFLVKRTINGPTVRNVEYLSDRTVGDIRDYCALDCSFSYDGRNTNTANTVTLTTGAGWTTDDTITVTAAVASTFASGDVGKVIQVTDGNGNRVDITITGYSSGTVVTGTPDRTVVAALRSTALTEWALAISVLGGLVPLNGESVAVVGDGFLVANPYRGTGKTVTNGVVTLDDAYAVIHVGLPYIVDAYSLNLQVPGVESMSERAVLVSRAILHVDKTRGLLVGPKPPSDDDADPTEGLDSPPEMFSDDEGGDESVDDPPQLTTGTIPINFSGEWNTHGRVFIRQIDPIPMGILSIEREGVIPSRGGP